MDPFKIINKYYTHDTLSYNILVEHSLMVMKKSVEIAKRLTHLDPDISFIEEAAMLHDIGIFLTDEPGIGCFGEEEYICHGYLGRNLLEKEGLPLHALVCERHVGMGLSISDIEQQCLPLPSRDMLPVSIEEKIICFADKFFSKKIVSLDAEKPIEEVRLSIQKYGHEKLKMFDDLNDLFNK
ncbi:MAG: HD domain-containing protein [Nitrospirota bacterium]